MKDHSVFLKNYDLIAVKLTTDQYLHEICVENDIIDIISFDFSLKSGWRFKEKILKVAMKKGMMFEICYSEAITDDS